MIELIDILHFDKNKNKRVPLKECEVCGRFMFAKNDYFIVQKKGYFWVCLLKDKDLYTVWVQKIGNNLYSEAISQFRKEYLKNKISEKDIQLFIENPLEYKKKKGLK